MGWPLAIAGIASAVAGSAGSIIGGDKAADASMAASKEAAHMQFLQLMYLASTERVSREIQDQALNELAVQYGLPGVEGGQFPLGKPPTFEEYREQLVPKLEKDPFYNTLRGQGEDAVLRGASATGGLRSGGTSEALAENSQNVLMGLYDKRMQEYLTQQQGLFNLAGLAQGGVQSEAIGRGIADIGRTTAQGTIAANQARQDALQGGINAGMRGLELAMEGYQI